MHRRKKRKRLSQQASVPLRQGYPARGALSGTLPGDQATTLNSDKERLSFRVDLPSRRWLEQAAANGAASTNP